MDEIENLIVDDLSALNVPMFDYCLALDLGKVLGIRLLVI
jgi:hypothetical protein